MKLGNEIVKIVPDNSESLSVEKFIKFLKENVGLNLVPVRGQYDKYWLSGKDGYDMIDGNKYYKLTYQPYGIDITCKGGYNAFSMKRHLADYIKEGVEKGKAEIRKAAEAC